MGNRLYVGNLSYDTNEQELQDLFGQAGKVASVTLPTDRDTGRMRGFAFVEMSTDAEAQEAIRKFNGTTLRDRQINVNEARPARIVGAAAVTVAVAARVAMAVAAAVRAAMAVVVVVVTVAAVAVRVAAAVVAAAVAGVAVVAATTAITDPLNALKR